MYLTTAFAFLSSLFYGLLLLIIGLLESYLFEFLIRRKDKSAILRPGDPTTGCTAPPEATASGVQ